MKALLIIIMLAVASYLGYSAFVHKNVIPSGVATSPNTAIPSPTAGVMGVETSKPLVPTQLIIPKIAVDTAIESVGMDAKGNMDVPQNADNAAWYNLGYKPGDNGSAVIDGHFDKETGAPAVFYDLAKLVPGDTIHIKQNNGEMLTFKVTGSATYEFDQLPLKEIFNTPGKPTLNLITCNGTFNKSDKNYSKRLVVRSELSN